MPTQDSKLKRLETLLNAIEDTVTKDEFVAAFEQVIKVVKDIKDTNNREFNAMHDFMMRFSGKVQGDTSASLEDLKKQVNTLFVEGKLKGMEDSMREMIVGEMDKMHSTMSTKMSQMRNGKDGINGKNGKDALPPSESYLVSLIEPLIPKVEAIAAKVPRPTRIQTPAKAFMVRKVDLTSQCDGVTKTFNVGGSHFGIMGVFSTEFPQIYRPIVDYTETVNGFTLTAAVNAPATGQTLICQFLK